MVARQSHQPATVVTDDKQRKRRSLVTASAAAIAGAVIVAVAFVLTRAPAQPHPAAAAPASTAAVPTPTAAGSSAGLLLPPLPNGPTGPAHAAPAAIPRTALPVRLAIPAIGVTTALEPLGLLPDHSLQPPSHWDEAGWYAGGVRPGDPGPAIVVGHVDSVSGPAVFYRLRDLRPGAVALVRLHTGRTLTFVIDTVQVYPKDQFPSAAVYGPTALPELRLITCTGDFDWSAHSYVDNLVVTAHLES
jgi:Sortase domain